MARDRKVEDYVAFLQDLQAHGQPHFLEGGQAVNFWAEFFTANGKAGGLDHFQPFTSKDCDVWVGHAAAGYLEHSTKGTLIKGRSPADGQLGILQLAGDPPRTVDLMTGVFGIPPREHEKLCQRALTLHGVTVLDPLNLFRSKCHCLVGLDQSGRQDERHLRMLALILPAYFSLLIAEAKSGRIKERAILREAKLLRRICSTQRCRRALAQAGIDTASLIPLQEMAGCGLELLARFATRSPE